MTVMEAAPAKFSTPLSPKLSADCYIGMVVLALLALQNSSASLVMRYSRGVLKEKYIPSGAVVLMELIKGSVCLLMIARERKHHTLHFLRHLLATSLTLSIPAALYFTQNNLAFVALQHLDSGVFNVLMQLKVLINAFLSVLILHRQLSWGKWRALLLLVTGVTIILCSSSGTSSYHYPHSCGTAPLPPKPPAILSMPADAPIANTSPLLEPPLPPPPFSLPRSKVAQLESTALAPTLPKSAKPVVASPSTDEGFQSALMALVSPFWLAPTTSFAIGVCSVLTICIFSGFASVYYEKILKSSSKSVWERNFQLVFYSLIFGTLQLLVNDYDFVAEFGFFYDYSLVTWLSILDGAVGGLLVAMVLRYADNIMTGFATSSSIILTSVVGFLFLDARLDYMFGLGVLVVLISLFNYSAEMDFGDLPLKPKEHSLSSLLELSVTPNGKEK